MFLSLPVLVRLLHHPRNEIDVDLWKTRTHPRKIIRAIKISSSRCARPFTSSTRLSKFSTPSESRVSPISRIAIQLLPSVGCARFHPQTPLPPPRPTAASPSSVRSASSSCLSTPTNNSASLRRNRTKLIGFRPAIAATFSRPSSSSCIPPRARPGKPLISSAFLSV